MIIMMTVGVREIKGLKMQTIYGLSGNIEFEQSCNNNARCDVIAIVCHPHPLHGGSMTNKVVTTVFKVLEKNCQIAIRFNYRGVGDSAGSYGDTDGEIADLISVITWARTTYGNKHIYLAGFSFGAYISLRVALILEDIDKLISIAPVVHHHDYNNLKEPHCQWEIIVGDEDELILMKDFDAWYDKFAHVSSMQKINGASHFFHGKLIELRNIVDEFINTTNN